MNCIIILYATPQTQKKKSIARKNSRANATLLLPSGIEYGASHLLLKPRFVFSTSSFGGKSRKKVDEFRLVPKEKNEAEVMINKILGRVGVLFKSV